MSHSFMNGSTSPRVITKYTECQGSSCISYCISYAQESITNCVFTDLHEEYVCYCSCRIQLGLHFDLLYWRHISLLVWLREFHKALLFSTLCCVDIHGILCKASLRYLSFKSYRFIKWILLSFLIVKIIILDSFFKHTICILQFFCWRNIHSENTALC